MQPEDPTDQPLSQKSAEQTPDASKPKLALVSVGNARKMSKLEREQMKARVKERRAKALDLWIASVPFQKMGDLLGVSNKTAWEDVHHELDRMNAETRERAETRKQRILLQIDRAVQGLWPKIMTGDTKANECLTAHLDMVAKLEGLYAPTKIAATTPDGAHWAPVAASLQRLTVEELSLLNKVAGMRMLPPTTAVDAEVVNE